MNILGINSSKKQAEISLFCDNQFFVHKMEETKSHSEFLLQEIEDFLFKHNLTIQQIDVLSINVGPGSFTGVRIGISFVKAFIAGLNQKTVVINNFELIDFNILNKPKSYYIVLNSNNEDFYYQEVDENKVYYGFINKQKLNEIVATTNELVFCDEKESSFFEGIRNLNFVKISDETLIKLSCEKTLKEKFVSINEISPLYIKKSQAEMGLQQKINENLILTNSANVEELFALEEKCFSCPYSKTLLEEDLKNKNRHLFFAKYNNELVGYINFEEVIDELNLLKICVLPEFREYGIASKLMQKMMDYFVENNLKSIFLEVDAKKFSAIKLYEKFGFEKIDLRKHYYENGDNAIIFRFTNNK